MRSIILKFAVGLLLLVGGFPLASCAQPEASRTLESTPKGAPVADPNLLLLDTSTESFDELLRRHVRNERVDYSSWHSSKEDLASLDRAIAGLQRVDTANINRSERLAFWINLYNAATLKLILDNYPVDSIKDIGGLFRSPWDRKLVEVGGRELSLNAIENEIIRVEFDEPRIHFALNCAAISCPPISNEAFRGQELERQLERSTRNALQQPRYFDASECVADGGRLRLSKIFDWYKEDFGDEAALRAFLARYHPDLRETILGDACSIKHLDYDWKLNRVTESSP